MGRKNRNIIHLLASALVFTGFFVPVGTLPLGPRFSVFDLISGMLAKGSWAPTRMILLFVFVATIAFFSTSVFRLVKPKNETVV